MTMVLEKLNIKKIIVSGVLLMSVLMGINAFAAMDKYSTAKLNFASKAIGDNVNIWDGKAKVTAKNDTAGSEPTFSATIKKSVTLLPDPTTWNKNMFSRGSFSSTVSISEASTYYAQASTLSPLGMGNVQVQSLDTSW
ncbi:hypothetical protein M3603_01235 [Rummeliibacillus stabekisii]|uniref:hypothetical protein n=1 Tax=Rummeliibacillus stabekisii TaxID=241244 RepID=UPI00203F7EA5|nr:hypothetical protein [Rummeliibacillus stabekisii]MCM3315282.1 hypothetical protein [Rummeliibacillus stabekisii]